MTYRVHPGQDLLRAKESLEAARCGNRPHARVLAMMSGLNAGNLGIDHCPLDGALEPELFEQWHWGHGIGTEARNGNKQETLL